MWTILNKSHISLISANEINQICKPLLRLGITTFIYIKNYKNGQVLHLSNRAGWLIHYYQKEFYRIDPLMNKSSIFPPGFFLWNTLDGRDIYYDAEIYFGITHGIVLARKNKAADEYYIFGGADNKTHFINVCINNLDLLGRFIFYFQNTAYSILKSAEKEKIVFSNDSIAKNVKNDGMVVNIPVVKSPQTYFNETREAFIQSTKMSGFKSEEIGNGLLSGRELDIIFYFLQNKTALEIGTAMNLSKKTVDWYLAEIRKRFKCASSKELKERLLAFDLGWGEITEIMG